MRILFRYDSHSRAAAHTFRKLTIVRTILDTLVLVQAVEVELSAKTLVMAHVAEVRWHDLLFKSSAIVNLESSSGTGPADDVFEALIRGIFKKVVQFEGKQQRLFPAALFAGADGPGRIRGQWLLMLLLQEDAVLLRLHSVAVHARLHLLPLRWISSEHAVLLRPHFVHAAVAAHARLHLFPLR